VAILDEVLEGTSEAERRRFYVETARQVYRLGGSGTG